MISLVESARMVGVSKKSLDDYYYQLRTAEKYGFDFMSYLNKKIGFLRNFNKSKVPKRKMGQRNNKHSRKLKIIEIFKNNKIH